MEINPTISSLDNQVQEIESLAQGLREYVRKENDVKKRSTRLDDLERGIGYTWGEVIRIHYIGEYSIIECHPWVTDGCKVCTGNADMETKSFHGYINRGSLSHSWDSLDEALAGCIAYKHEGCNHKADGYFMKMIGVIK